MDERTGHDAEGRGGRGPGRPRSREATEAILAAVIDLLADGGFEAVTMERVAARAGVGKTTIYRRWSSKESLLRAAVVSVVRGTAIPNTGRVREDLLALERDAVSAYRGKPGRLLPGLVSAMAHDPALAATVRDDLLRSRRAALRTVLRRGVERGELRSGMDLELALDCLSGPLFHRLLITGGSLDDDVAEGVVEVVLDGLAGGDRPPTSSS